MAPVKVEGTLAFGPEMGAGPTVIWPAPPPVKTLGAVERLIWAGNIIVRLVVVFVFDRVSANTSWLFATLPPPETCQLQHAGVVIFVGGGSGFGTNCWAHMAKTGEAMPAVFDPPVCTKLRPPNPCGMMVGRGAGIVVAVVPDWLVTSMPRLADDGPGINSKSGNGARLSLGVQVTKASSGRLAASASDFPTPMSNSRLHAWRTVKSIESMSRLAGTLSTELSLRLKRLRVKDLMGNFCDRLPARPNPYRATGSCKCAASIAVNSACTPGHPANIPVSKVVRRLNRIGEFDRSRANPPAL